MRIAESLGLATERVLICCRAALEAYGRGVVEVWPRTESWSEFTGLRLYMPARMGEWEGFKVIREDPSTSDGRLGRRTAWMIVRRPLDKKAWWLPADAITDARTGAAGALAAEFLAPPSRKAAIIGTGRVARSLARSLAELTRQGGRLSSLRGVEFFSRSEERRRRFHADLGPGLDLPLIEAESAAEALRGAGVVLLAAASPVPVVEADQLDPVVHVSALSGGPFSHALGISTLIQANLIVVDEMTQCLQSGEMIDLAAQGCLEQLRFARAAAPLGDRAAHIGDAAIGRIQRPKDGISIAFLSGLAILDLAVAIEVVLSGGVQPLDVVHAGLSGPGEEDDPWRPIP